MRDRPIPHPNAAEFRVVALARGRGRPSYVSEVDTLPACEALKLREEAKGVTGLRIDHVGPRDRRRKRGTPPLVELATVKVGGTDAARLIDVLVRGEVARRQEVAAMRAELRVEASVIRRALKSVEPGAKVAALERCDFLRAALAERLRAVESAIDSTLTLAVMAKQAAQGRRQRPASARAAHETTHPGSASRVHARR